ASLGQRKRVAHIPTAEAEAARSGLILEGQGQARLHLKSNPSWSHEWGPVQTASRTSVLRLAANDLRTQQGRPWGQPQASAAADAGDGDRGAGSPPRHEQSRARAQDIPLPAARPE